ncbi:hypothetical protein J437_LFUL011322 [Ladona fulva]|uniref:Cytokine-inducible SH2-containing protein n=1 Tax=Ladona fulva TaxID=123851 RepID=A0A8K0KKI5_LADFU|nr:hypothetical protein J437_LFUL011322 [Ladona fulva]
MESVQKSETKAQNYENSPRNGSEGGVQFGRPVSDGAPTMLTCPNCLHAFGHPSSGGPSHSSPAPTVPSTQNSCCHANTLHPGCTSQSTPMLLAPTRHPSAHTTCTVAVSRSSSAPAGGRCSVYITRDPDEEDSTDKFLPQPSPSVPLSFVLPMPAAPAIITTAASSNQWTVTTANPSSPFLATIVPWTHAPPTPSHEIPAWPWNGSPAVVVPASLLVPPPNASQIPVPTAVVAPTLNNNTAPCEPPEGDLDRLAATLRALRSSGWYYEGLTWQGSATVLADSPPGTFLVRDSSDSRFLFALSVQTQRGPTSVRLHYSQGRFRLDAEPRLAAMMPLFDGVVRLVEHYVEEGKRRAKSGGVPPPGSKPVGNQVWVDSRGRVCAHVMLNRPRYRSTPSLQHLARLAVNKRLKESKRDVKAAAISLRLPAPLIDYLADYPHTL